MPDGRGSVVRRINLGRAARDPFLIGVTGLVVVAAALRFSTLDLQSYSSDEGFTVWLVRQSPVEMVRGIARTESTPPLYYCVAWVWSRLFGTGEAGLRSLSAMVGTATVLVAYLAAARMLSRPAGLVVAALAAVSPFMVWYSQWARSYALFMLLATLSIYLYALLRGNPRPAHVVAWAVVCEASIWTHYFAGYLVATEALLLVLFVPRARRAVAAASLAIALAAVPVAALAVHQQRSGNSAWIARMPLPGRISGAAEEFVFGQYQLAHERFALALLVVVVVLLLAGSRSRAITPGLAEVALFGTGMVALPLVAAALGKDYWLAKNVMPAWICAAMILALGVVMVRPRWLKWLLAAALVSLSFVPTLRIFESPEFQIRNWRALARCLGAQRRGRVVVIPFGEALVLNLYRPGTRRLGDQAKLVDEVDVVDRSPVNLPVQFASAGTACQTTFIPVSRFTAQKLIPVSALDLLAPSSTSHEVRMDRPQLDPVARHGPAGIVAAYLRRPFRLAAQAPRGFLAWRSARRRASEVSSSNFSGL
jgi:mannosyltransferase